MQKDLVQHEESNCAYPGQRSDPFFGSDYYGPLEDQLRPGDMMSTFERDEMERFMLPPTTSGGGAPRKTAATKRTNQKETARKQNLKKIPNNEIERENSRASTSTRGAKTAARGRGVSKRGGKTSQVTAKKDDSDEEGIVH